jgi:DNA-binding protein H-NS
MMEKLITRFVESVFWRLLTIGAFTVLSTVIVTSWEGAAYLSLLFGDSFPKTFLGLVVFGTIGGLGTAFAILYPVELWVIRDKASKSWKWIVIRLVIYFLTSFPGSIGILVSMRFGMKQYPDIVESIYFVSAVSVALTAAILYSLSEQIIKEVKKQESKLKAEIKELHIEIDQLKRQKQVVEITESDFFQDLQKKAASMRKGKNVPSPISNVAP